MSYCRFAEGGAYNLRIVGESGLTCMACRLSENMEIPEPRKVQIFRGGIIRSTSKCAVPLIRPWTLLDRVLGRRPSEELVKKPDLPAVLRGRIAGSMVGNLTLWTGTTT